MSETETRAPERFLRIGEVCEWVGVSRSTIKRWVRARKFPPPIRLGERITLWLEREVVAWMRARMAGRMLETKT